MEESHKDEKCTCITGTCCHRHYLAHYLLRWVLGIIVILFVFCLGVNVGELTADYRGWDSGYGFGPRMMIRGYYDGGYGAPMMYWGTGSAGAPVKGAAAPAGAATQGTAR